MIRKACEKGGGVSSTRLTSFIITGIIITFCIYFLFVGVYVVVTGCNSANEVIVSIPAEMLIVFGSLLAHQLTLLGINKHNETKQKIASNNNESGANDEGKQLNS